MEPGGSDVFRLQVPSEEKPILETGVLEASHIYKLDVYFELGIMDCPLFSCAPMETGQGSHHLGLTFDLSRQ